MNKIEKFMVTRRQAFIVEKGTKNVSDSLMKSFIATVIQLGFILSEELIAVFKTLSAPVFNTMSTMLLDLLKEEKGADVDMSNFLFPDFPNQTRMTDLENLSELRFAGYLADFFGWYLDDPHLRRFLNLGKYAEHTDRSPLEIDKEALTTIQLATMEDFYELSNNLIGSRMALTPSDKEILEAILTDSKGIEIQKMIPAEIPFKENLAWMIQVNQKVPFGLKIQMKSFIDVKRAYAALINEDVTLKENFRLKNLKNQDRKWLLTQMERGLKGYRDSFWESAYKEREFVLLFWNRIHPENYKSVAPETVNLLKDIKNGMHVETTSSKIESALSSGNTVEAAKLAIANPGDAIRRLAHMLSRSSVEEGKEVIQIIEGRAHEVDTSVLLNTKCAIDNFEEESLKVAFPKGLASKAQIFEEKKAIHPELLREASKMLERAIIKRLSTKEALGKVFIEDSIENYNVPFATRDEASGFKTVSRGSRLFVDENAEVLRFFVYKQIARGGFVDLSVTFLSDTFSLVEQCSWTNLKTDNSGKPLAMHSGDGCNCQEGLSEFVDVDMTVLKTWAKDHGVRYLAPQILSYNHIPFKNMDRCFAGLMVRKGMMTDKLPDGRNYSRLSKEEQQKVTDFNGEVFEPSTVFIKSELTRNSMVNVPFIYDIVKNVVIWADLDVSGFKTSSLVNAEDLSDGGNVALWDKSLLTVENLVGPVAIACYSICYLKKPNMKDLVMLNLKARHGALVFNREDADIIVSDDDNATVSPFNRDIITKEWM